MPLRRLLRRPLRVQLAPSLLLQLLLPIAAPRRAHAQDGVRVPTLAAARTLAPVRVDGALTEAAWRDAPVARRFRQVEPLQGRDASLDTEVRVLFDRRHLYVGIVARDALGADGVRARDLRRDFNGTTDDYVGVVLDPFRERRSAVLLLVGPYGNQRDAQVLDGGLVDVDWDGVWTVRTAVSDSGWTAEFAIPWATLRYPPGGGDWAVNFIRSARRINETSGWSPWPRQMRETRTEYAGRLTALEPPARQPSRLRVQPYVVARAERERDVVAAAAPERRRTATLGGEARWSVTPAAVLDVAVNPDFGQADADRQIVNLSQFAVTLPERRAFFLENRTVFALGDGQFEPFASRRVGLDDAGSPIAIDAGARFVSRAAARNAGALLVQQRDGAATTRFGVTRYVQHFGARARLGVLTTSRLDAPTDASATAENHVLAVDGFVRPLPSLSLRGFVAGSLDRRADAAADRLTGLAGQALLAYEGRTSALQWLQEYVGADYRARAGVVPRTDYLRTNATAAFDLRPAWLPGGVRRLHPSVGLAAAQRASDRRLIEGTLSSRPIEVQFGNGARIGGIVRADRLQPPTDFAPVPGIVIAPGRYDNLRGRVDVASDPSRAIAAHAGHVFGGYFDGRFWNWDVGANVTPDPRLALGVEYVRLHLVGVGRGDSTRTTHLVTPELRLAASPRLQLTSFYQYNTAARQAAVNLRLAWEYAPLSFLYVVYNGREPVGLGPQATSAPRSGRQLLLKLSYIGQL